jgi:5-formyltetrahydrofolate cyclo-ligase
VGTTDKAKWRAELIAARKARSDADRARARAAICRHVLSRHDEQQWACVAAYEPLGTEPGSVELLAGLYERGVRVLVPITLADRDLDWTLWTPGRNAAPLAIGGESDLGRQAIGAADLVLVPALAVAADGTRLGRGGGSYDRALGRRAQHIVAAALVFEPEVVPELPHDSWDVPVDAAVTPEGWRTFRGNTADAEPG